MSGLSFVVVGQMVRHDCDNPPCVNPGHLRLGTGKDNNGDQIKRGRTATGDKNGSRQHPERLLRGPESPQYRPAECRNGHPADRRYTRPSTGERVCRDCVAARQRRARATARAEGRPLW